ncbi:hypothetical protein [Mariniflexile sp. HMF6888]|uniref:hypothetical protein n=1 Tax=Mariniflexile sp. HMF6888 TaxID=3373086 RepID=UPI0037B3D395
MKSNEKVLCENLRNFKVHYLNTSRKLKKDLLRLQEENERLKSLDELLTINEVEVEFKKNRKTIDRWRIKGLKVYQSGHGKSIPIKIGERDAT